MKSIGLSIIINICLLMITLAGFSVQSLAGLFQCSVCGQQFDVAEQNENNKHIAGASLVCKTCIEKANLQNTCSNCKLTDNPGERSKESCKDDSTDYLCGCKKRKTPAVIYKNTDNYRTFLKSTIEDKLDFNPKEDYWDLMNIKSRDRFIISLLTSLNAQTSYIDPDDPEISAEMEFMLAINQKINPWTLKEHIDQIKIDPETDDNHCYSSDARLPDFFVTSGQAIVDGNDVAGKARMLTPRVMTQRYLAERKTPETIQSTIDRIEAKSRKEREKNTGSEAVSYTEFLYLITELKDENDKVILDPFVINVKFDDQGETEGAKLHFFDDSASAWYQLSGEKAHNFIDYCMQWAAIHKHRLGFYNLVKHSFFMQPQECEQKGFTYSTLGNIVSRIISHYKFTDDFERMKTELNDAEKQECTVLLASLREKVKNQKIKKVLYPYIEWYKTTWCAHKQSYKSFVLKLSKRRGPDGRDIQIIATQVSDNMYGLALLDDDNTYLFFPKMYMGILAKQLMWLAHTIAVHEIIEE